MEDKLGSDIGPNAGWSGTRTLEIGRFRNREAEG